MRRRKEEAREGEQIGKGKGVKNNSQVTRMVGRCGAVAKKRPDEKQI